MSDKEDNTEKDIELMLMNEDNDSNYSQESDNESEGDAFLRQYQEKLEFISENKFQYQAYVELLDLAHNLNELEYIREGIKRFSVNFPIAPEIWLRYLKIEINVAHSKNEIETLCTIFSKAISDYYSADLTMEYFNVADKSDKQTALNILEEIVSGHIINCMRGREIFGRWLNTYSALEEDPKVKCKKIAIEYMDFLDVPHYGIDNTFDEFKLFFEEHKEFLQDEVKMNEVEINYKETHKAFLKILPFEKKLNSFIDPNDLGSQRAQIYQDYIALCDQDKVFSSDYIQMLYERMATECCLIAAVWLNYMKFAQKRAWKRKKNGSNQVIRCSYMRQKPKEIAQRAINNLRWDPEIWIESMRIAERAEDTTPADMKNILELAMEVSYQTPEPIVAIWMEYFGYLRRQFEKTLIDSPDEAAMAGEKMSDTFDYAWKALGLHWGVLADCDCEILQFWGRIEYDLLRNPAKGKQLWSTVMDSSDNASKSAMWIEYAQLECFYGSIESSRRIYQKALKNHSLDNTDVVVVAWKRFERTYGTLDSLAACECHCKEVMEALWKRQLKLAKKARPEKSGIARKEETDTKKKTTDFEQKTVKRKAPANEYEDTKRHKPEVPDIVKSNNLQASATSEAPEEIDITKDNVRIFFSNLDYNVTEEEIREAFPELNIVKIDIIKAATGRGRGYGYAELASVFDVNRALKLDNRPIKNRPAYISTVNRDKDQRGKFKYSEGLEPTKLFVKGIPYESTKEELEILFAEHGVVKDIRIVYHKSGKSKGIAYVEYDNAQSAKAAVMKLDEFDLKNHRLSVSISAPPPKRVMPSSSQNKLLKGLGLGQRGRAPPPGEAKPRMSFIPRALQQKAAQSEAAPPEQIKSNDDFRKMLLK